ncbi:MAG: PEP-CTERM sorting domain-containing protein [Acidobacteriota bacterium]|nr:PEP-CTERM sorting domain-containing protein [Acidobacteriota bacterium]
MRFTLLAFASILSFSAFTSPLLADNIHYPSVGQLAPAASLTAAHTGQVTGYFVSASAADNDSVELWDMSRNTFSGFLLPNHSSTPDVAVNFGSVNGGDRLAVILFNSTTGKHFDSINTDATPTSFSVDGRNHAYVTPYTGGISGIPAGIYIGMEDLGVTSLKPLTGTDLDYNDDTFVFTNVAIAPTPEPGTFLLLGTGLLGAAGSLRRKFAR